MLNLTDMKKIKRDFIHTYKHPYINISLYNDLLHDEQIYFYEQLFNEIDHFEKREILLHALLHIQCSIDVHDQIELHFDSNIIDDDFEVKQLKILAGDFHSALFYKLLTKNHMLDELYHFINTIKNINQSKMTFIHHAELNNITTDQLFKDLETIYAGLFDSLAQFFNISNYETKWKPHIYYHLIYNRENVKNTKWIKYLMQIDDNLNEVYLNKKNNWFNQLT